ncbi:hypothetical protein R3P38DRAFT_3235631 [Favolaschia claudopus]|uniref:Uncharacterized protein n=1 Tax=Favolaschia claudopus TaxID=2862362 RepID=A0AAV9ZE25_9AGAR
MSQRRRGRPAFTNLNLGDIEEESNVDNFAVTADRGIYISIDGRRRNEELLNISHKKRRLEPRNLNDNLAEWIPIPEDNFAEEDVRAAVGDATDSGARVPGQQYR